MGKATYQNEPPRSSGASTYSLQPYSDDTEGDRPPAYTETEPPSIDAPSQQPISSSAFLPDEDAYDIEGGLRCTGGARGSKESTIVTLQPYLSSNPKELWKLIKAKAELPPRPYILVQGAHTQSKDDGKGGRKKETIIDFNFNLDVAGTVLRGWKGDGMPPSQLPWHTVTVVGDGSLEKAYRGGRFKSCSPGKYDWPGCRSAFSAGEDVERGQGGYVDDEDEAEAAPLVSEEDEDQDENQGTDGAQSQERHYGDSLLGWCERFCADPAPVKSFTLRRVLKDFSSDSLQESITSHIRAISYRGHVTVKTSLREASVTIYSPHWVNRARHNDLIYWTCIILQLWIITWPIILLLEHKYEVVFSNWHASQLIVQQDTSDPNNPRATTRRKVYARDRDEVALIDYWAPAIKHAAWNRRSSGEVVSEQDVRIFTGRSDDEILGSGRSGVESEDERDRRARMNRGQGTWADSFVGVVRGVSDVGREWTRARGWGADC